MDALTNTHDFNRSLYDKACMCEAYRLIYVILNIFGKRIKTER